MTHAQTIQYRDSVNVAPDGRPTMHYAMTAARKILEMPFSNKEKPKDREELRRFAMALFVACGYTIDETFAFFKMTGANGNTPRPHTIDDARDMVFMAREDWGENLFRQIGFDFAAKAERMRRAVR